MNVNSDKQKEVRMDEKQLKAKHVTNRSILTRRTIDQWDQEEGLEAFTPEGLDFVPKQERYFE